MFPSAFAPYARAASDRWNRWLRRSVRLYLALDEPQVNKRLIEDELLLIQWKLVRHIVDGDAPTRLLTQQAQDIVEMAQAGLLGSEVEVRDLRREMSAEQAVHPWHKSSQMAA
jgi:hypothetical protein